MAVEGHSRSPIWYRPEARMWLPIITTYILFRTAFNSYRWAEVYSGEGIVKSEWVMGCESVDDKVDELARVKQVTEKETDVQEADEVTRETDSS